MNYKKRNFIGIISFITIIIVMINLNSILESLNAKIIGKKFIGVKGDTLFLNDLDEEIITKIELIDFINKNFEEMELKKSNDYEFSIYTRDVLGDDKFKEIFRIDMNEDFVDSLYQNLENIEKNKDIFVKFVLYINKDSYVSESYPLKFVDELYKTEGKILVELKDYTKVGTKSYVKIPEYLNLKNDSKLSISAKYEELDVSDLECSFNSETNELVIGNIVPLKTYSFITITTKDIDGVDVILNMRSLLTNPENDLEKYISSVYSTTLGRKAYESEYNKNLQELSSGSISFRDFILGVMDYEEFNTFNDTSKKIVDSIYFMANNEKITARMATLVLDEFNDKLTNQETFKDAKVLILDKFLSNENTVKKIKEELNVVI